jgi:predicted nucleic acid-binding protein
MSGRSFLDTNVLVYTDDQDAPDKQKIALDLVERARIEAVGVVSTQVLQEYYSAATRKLGVLPDTARRKVELFAHFDLVPVELDLILTAIDFHRLNSVSFWDALIIRAALVSGCTILYSEDLQTGRRIDGLQIVNPFGQP